jgi:ABC-type branched-subunit amino acid transport system substrate-binding protein
MAIDILSMKRRFSLSRMAAFGVIWLSISSCAKPKQNGQTAKGTLEIRAMWDFTGPTSREIVPFSHGIRDYVDRVNAEGGVQGYLIHLESADTGYDEQRSADLYARWKEAPSWSGVVGVFVNGTHITRRLSPQATEDQMPLFTTSYAGSLSSPVPVTVDADLPDGSRYQASVPGAPFVFHPSTDYTSAARVALQYMRSTGATRVAFAFDPNQEFPKAPVPGGKAFAQELGLTVSDDLTVPLGGGLETIQTNVDAYFADGAHADVQWLWMGNTSDTTYKLMAALGNNPAAANVKVISNPQGFDEDAFSVVGSFTSATENPSVGRLFGTMPFSAFGDFSEGMERLLDIHGAARQAAGEDAALYANVSYVKGHVTFLLWLRAVEAILARGETVTGTAIKETLESFPAISTDGLTAELTYSAVDHRPSGTTRVYGVNRFGRLEYKEERTVPLKEEWKGW